MDYETLKSKAFKAARDVKKSSENLYESTKLSFQIGKLKNSLEDKYAIIGRLVYNAHAGNDTPGDKVRSICDEIDAIICEIQQLTSKKEDIKAGCKCSVCGCPVGKNDTNCPNCGCQL